MAFRKKVFRKPRRNAAKKAYVKRTRPLRRYKKRATGIRPFMFPTVAPPRLMTKLHYEEVLSISYAGTASCTYRTSSLFDPQLQLTGMTATGISDNKQPGWFDALKTWYRAYTVRGCLVSMSFNNNSATEIVNAQYIATSTSDGPIATTYDWTTLHAKYKGSFIQGLSTSNPTYRKLYIDNYKVGGNSKADSSLTQNNLLTAAVTSEPTIGPYFQFNCRCADGSGTVSGILKIHFVYYTEFFDRKMIPGADTGA